MRHRELEMSSHTMDLASTRQQRWQLSQQSLKEWWSLSSPLLVLFPDRHFPALLTPAKPPHCPSLSTQSCFHGSPCLQSSQLWDIHGDVKNSPHNLGLLLVCDVSANLISDTTWRFSKSPCCLREQKAVSQRAHYLKMLGL